MQTPAIGIAIIALFAPYQSDTATCLKDCKLTNSDLVFTRNWEGFSPIVYKDAGGNSTIGFGHALKPGESYTYLTPDQAQSVLNDDMKPVVSEINAAATRPLREGEVGSIADLLFNTGTRGKENLFTRVNKMVDPQFILFDKAKINGKEVVLKGLKARRQAEAALYNL